MARTGASRVAGDGGEDVGIVAPPEGAMLAVRDDGAVVGSVSGGCIEDDLIERVRQRGIEQTKPESVKYGISAEEAHRFGLPCGGTIQLVMEPLTWRAGSWNSAKPSRRGGWWRERSICRTGTSGWDRPKPPTACYSMTRASSPFTGRGIGCS